MDETIRGRAVATNDDKIIEWLKSRKEDQSGFNVDAAWSRFEAANDLTDVRPLRRRPRPIIWSLAAAAVIAGVGLGVWQYAASQSSRVIEQVAANGEQKTIQLGDGSSVTLKGG